MMPPLVLSSSSPTGFAIDSSSKDSEPMTLRFRGVADMSSIEPLDVYLRAVHEELRTSHSASVVVDFRALEFMNSSCFKCFVEWLGAVQDAAPSERYRVVFQTNHALHWQRRSLNALRCFAMDVVTIRH